jgi:hypothetical protein
LKQQTKSEFIGWRSDDPLICPGVEDFQWNLFRDNNNLLKSITLRKIFKLFELLK